MYFHRNIRIQTDSIKMPIQVNTIRSGHVTHVPASALDYHLDHSLVVLNHKQMSTIWRIWWVWWHIVNGIPVCAWMLLGLG